MSDLVNAAKLAKHLGASRAAISKAVASGRLVPVHVHENGRMLFDLATAEAAWGDRPNPKATRRDSAGIVSTPSEGDAQPTTRAHAPRELTGNQKLTKAKIAREVYTAAMKRMEIEEKQGKLVRIEDVEKEAAELYRILLSVLEALPSRLHQQLSVMTDSREIYDLLANEVNHMIAAIRKLCGVDDGNAEDAGEKEAD